MVPMPILVRHHRSLYVELPRKHHNDQQFAQEPAGLLLQEIHLSGRRNAAGERLEKDFAPYGPALLHLVSSMLQPKDKRKSAEDLLCLPVMARLPQL